VKTGRMRFAPTVATEINKMLLPRWGELCCVPNCRGRCQRLMGVALSGRSLVHSGENGNVYSLVCWSIENDYTRGSAIANPDGVGGGGQIPIRPYR